MPLGARIPVLTISVLAALVFVGLLVYRLQVRTDPPSPDDRRAWHWVAAEPGANVYVGSRVRLGSASNASVWVDRWYFDNPSGISVHITEFMEFDCDKRMMRTVAKLSQRTDVYERANPTVIQAPTSWSPVGRHTPTDRVISFVCAQMPASAVARELRALPPRSDVVLARREIR
jgi:hypothetical protein